MANTKIPASVKPSQLTCFFCVAPQLGQAFAFVLKTFLHSGHFFNAIFGSLFDFDDKAKFTRSVKHIPVYEFLRQHPNNLAVTPGICKERRKVGIGVG